MNIASRPFTVLYTSRIPCNIFRFAIFCSADLDESQFGRGLRGRVEKQRIQRVLRCKHIWIPMMLDCRKVLRVFVDLLGLASARSVLRHVPWLRALRHDPAWVDMAGRAQAVYNEDGQFQGPGVRTQASCLQS